MLNGLDATLSARGNQHSQWFGPNTSQVWQRGNEAFAEVVERVGKAHADSQPHLSHLASSLFNHSEALRGRAIDLLLSAFERNVLDVYGQNELVGYLFTTERFGSAIPVLDEMIRVYPDEATYRQSRMTALHRTSQRDRLLAELHHIRSKLIVPETAPIDQVRTLAATCQACELWNEAAELYKTVVGRSGWPIQPSQSSSNAWRNLAECQAKLKQTPEAVDSVSAAWVVCGQNAGCRAAAATTLHGVMSQADDLLAITALLDRKAIESGDDSSFLRRALGKALLDRKQPAAAEAQLRIALELQPLDNDGWTWLIASLDQQDRFVDSAAVVLDQSDTDVRSTQHYRELHRRLTLLCLSGEAERAANSMVEVGMSESDNHAALAQLRESQQRLSAAAHHWKLATDLRREDPMLLIQLAKVQIRRGDDIGARGTQFRLTLGDWDARFKELPSELRKLRRQLQ